MLMSMSVGPFCDLAQDVDSKDWRQGAVVSLKLDENERECKFVSSVSLGIMESNVLVDRCPMYFNDGEDPWTVEENFIKVFDFNNLNVGAALLPTWTCFISAVWLTRLML